MAAPAVSLRSELPALVTRRHGRGLHVSFPHQYTLAIHAHVVDSDIHIVLSFVPRYVTLAANHLRSVIVRHHRHVRIESVWHAMYKSA